MSLLLQQCIVAVLVLFAALVAVWRLSSAALKVRMLDALLAWMPEPGGRAGAVRAALLRRRAKAALSGCGACAPATKSASHTRQ